MSSFSRSSSQHDVKPHHLNILLLIRYRKLGTGKLRTKDAAAQYIH
jgi:hypothetical protein